MYVCIYITVKRYIASSLVPLCGGGKDVMRKDRARGEKGGGALSPHSRGVGWGLVTNQHPHSSSAAPLALWKAVIKL